VVVILTVTILRGNSSLSNAGQLIPPDDLEPIRVVDGFGVDSTFPERHSELRAGLVGWWSLAEGAGATARDRGGLGLDGTLSGLTKYPSWTVDGEAAALTFDGRETEVRVPADGRWVGQQGVSVSAWVALAAEADGVIVGKWSAGAALAGSYTLSVLEGHLAAELSVRGQYWPLIAPERLPADGQWHQVGLVYDGFEVRLYVDGRRVATTHVGGAVDVGDEELVIGQASGAVADVRVFGMALTDADMVLVTQGRPALPQVEGLGARAATRHPRLPVGQRGAG
jgi:hypothetical protein